MSLVAARSRTFREKDYTEQLIFSDRKSDSQKNKWGALVIVLLFTLFIMNIGQALAHNATFATYFMH